MEYEIKTVGAGTELFLRGRLTFESNERFRKVMEAAGAQPGQTIRHLTIDVAGLDFIDSAGLGMLLLLHEAVTAKGGRLGLRRARGQVGRLLAAAHFERLVAMTA